MRRRSSSLPFLPLSLASHVPLVVLAILVLWAPGTGSDATPPASPPPVLGRQPVSLLGHQPLGLVSATGPAWLDTADRDAVVDAYRDEMSAPAPSLAWDGDHASCDGGTTSLGSRQATIGRVNYYRAMAGVPAVITEDPDHTAKARHTAMMMSVEGELTHSPNPPFACFTVDGQQGAANANLYLGRTGPPAVDGYIEDPGAGNTDVGHRNTILHPPTRRMGVGDVAAGPGGYAANALWVFDDHVFEETTPLRPEVREPERFVAWPPRGHVPHPIVHPRWSFMLAGADFSQAVVTVHRLEGGESEPVPVEVVARVGVPGHVPLPAVVWEPALVPNPAADETYLVVVSGVRPLVASEPALASGSAEATGAEAPPIQSRYTYRVEIIGPDVLDQ